jgi:hypothetical protein
VERRRRLADDDDDLALRSAAAARRTRAGEEGDAPWPLWRRLGITVVVSISAPVGGKASRLRRRDMLLRMPIYYCPVATPLCTHGPPVWPAGPAWA